MQKPEAEQVAGEERGQVIGIKFRTVFEMMDEGCYGECMHLIRTSDVYDPKDLPPKVGQLLQETRSDVAKLANFIAAVTPETKETLHENILRISVRMNDLRLLSKIILAKEQSLRCLSATDKKLLAELPDNPSDLQLLETRLSIQGNLVEDFRFGKIIGRESDGALMVQWDGEKKPMRLAPALTVLLREFPDGTEFQADVLLTESRNLCVGVHNCKTISIQEENAKIRAWLGE